MQPCLSGFNPQHHMLLCHDRAQGSEQPGAEAFMMVDVPGFFQGTEMPTAGWWEALFPDPAGLLAQVGLTRDMEAIDLCCGDGWFTLQIAKIARRLVAIDIDPALLAVARSRLTEAGTTNCDFVAGDAYDIARLVRHPHDFVFLANVFHGVPDRRRLAQEVASVLKPGGLFVIVNWHARPREETTVLGEPRGPKTELRIGPDATKVAVESIDLRLSRVVEIPPYHYGALFRRSGR
jgi:SAM-dependent methyltransferase